MTEQEAVEHAAAESVAALVLSGAVSSRKQLEAAKKAASQRTGLSRYLSNAEVLAAAPPDRREDLESILRVHPRRSASGIVVVTAFSAPFSCPHGTCVFCPGGPRFGTPQSYLKDSPGMRSALAADFDPFRQVRKSLSVYTSNGHEVSKVETIIEGGTFIAVPTDYQTAFVKGVYEGLNGYPSPTLEAAKAANEVASSRCVGLTLETKPDRCSPAEVDLMLGYGVTRLEVGVQSLRNDVLLKSNRGHSVEDSARALQVARDSGLKVAVHMMPGLPGSDPATDLEDLRALFEDDRFRPDMMKVYPTLVVVGSALQRLHDAGRFSAYEQEEVVELLSEMKRFVPRWHRIMRIQREIPAHEIVAGVKAGNLRQLVLRRVEEKGFACRCIRCREVALDVPDAASAEDPLRLVMERYDASGGRETFISFERERSGRIAAFVRVRYPSELVHRPEFASACVVRELRVYGREVRVGGRSEAGWQHRGLGRRLMAEAERATIEEFDRRKLLVTAAVGTRDYYRRLGYRQEGPYMAKSLG